MNKFTLWSINVCWVRISKERHYYTFRWLFMRANFLVKLSVAFYIKIEQPIKVPAVEQHLHLKHPTFVSTINFYAKHFFYLHSQFEKLITGYILFFLFLKIFYYFKLKYISIYSVNTSGNTTRVDIKVPPHSLDLLCIFTTLIRAWEEKCGVLLHNPLDTRSRCTDKGIK